MARLNSCGVSRLYLDAVLEAVKLPAKPWVSYKRSKDNEHESATQRAEVVMGKKGGRLTSQQEFAIWQPAWPTARASQ